MKILILHAKKKKKIKGLPASNNIAVIVKHSSQDVEKLFQKLIAGNGK